MTTAEELKAIVRQKYGDIARQEETQGVTVDGGCGPSSCCGPAATDASYSILMNDEYQTIDGYVADADLGLGCGLPTQFAQIKPGDTVVDLGSGAGNDCFVARAETGETGRVIGLDMTPGMIDRARKNAKALNYTNVEFVYGDIEDIPLPDNLADVVVSNCVMNLVPDKARAFQETYRILKPGGHFSISDIVLVGDLPEGLQRDAELYAGCVSGAIQERDYLDIVTRSGFTALQVQKKKEINLPTELLRTYITADELAAYRQDGRGIYSITVFARKPLTDPKPASPSAESCCGPTCCNG
ncbi:MULTISPECIES: arsenite methyltransferase [Spirosoma]|uniref:Arsenite methyltransferase n=1 Tax=Spirosoma sordidisoli TaxID=2502893 RepID=A0A4Q2UNW9_9BACT|nr:MULTISPECIES: arsenite methyltransferase [Spirosoma]RYC71407.1 arsenite methyltransferase [Spirosoma sordidisoli]